MRVAIVVLAALLIGACAYKDRVSHLSDRELCENLGAYTLKAHDEGVRITREEIQSRQIDADRCQRMAAETIERIRPDYKIGQCKALADYHYEGQYKPFRKTVDRLAERGLADKECETIAEFRYQEIARERERAARVRNALQKAAAQFANRPPVTQTIYIHEY